MNSSAAYPLTTRVYVDFTFSYHCFADNYIQVLVKVVTKDGVREVPFDNERIARSA